MYLACTCSGPNDLTH
uniref:Uncharacterized protein n=1 Tax=Anguilla anguilla TaxID=7936 RepID=A0A0E9Q3S0_ANGAN